MGKFIYRMILVVAVTVATAAGVIYYETKVDGNRQYEAGTLVWKQFEQVGKDMI